MTALDRLAALFVYPDAGYRRLAEESASIAGDGPMRHFADGIAHMRTTDLQERFVEVFDFDPDCAPDLGWHLFGERYERGEWLVSLSADMRRLGIETSNGLPDHLSNVLRLLARDDPERAAALAGVVSPAIEKLQGALTKRDSVYRHAIEAVQQVIGQFVAAGGAHA